MKKTFLYCLLITSAITAFIACQKEVSFENPKPSAGTLRIDSAGLGDCLPKIVSGAFVSGRALTDSNFIEVEVLVVTPGSYTITSDTVAGYFFRGTGNFANAGINKVKLKGSGTPASAGAHEFRIGYNNSFCTVEVVVLPAGATGPAVYTLGSSGNCPAIAVAGSYFRGAALTSSNNIVFQINATSVGSFALSTDTVNGFHFSANSSLTGTGVQNITLTGSGTPLTADSTTFRLRSGTMVCTFRVAVSGNQPPPPPLPGGNCVDSVLGNYVAGTALNGTNKVNLKHAFLSAGTFIVSTNTVNGYSFKDTVVSNTSPALTDIQLNGAGTPLVTGINTFVITFGDGTTCSFNVTVTATVPPPPPPPMTGVYFPLTLNSYWTYGDPGGTDTAKRAVRDSVIRNGRQFKLLVDTDMLGDTAHNFFRREANDYYEHAYVDDYSLVFFAEDIYGDILFLKEGLATGATWTSAEWTGTDTSDNVRKKLRYAFTCTDANATVTVGANAFTNVYKISFKSQLAPVGSTTWTDEGLTWNAWYARGVGMISLKAFFIGVPDPLFEIGIRRWQVL